MPRLFALTTTNYLEFDDNSNSWVSRGAAPAGSGTKLKYFGNGVLAHLAAGTVYRSVDYGVTFTAATPPLPGLTCVAYDIAVSTLIWAVWSDGSVKTVYTSFDGVTWTSTGHTVGLGVAVFDLVCNPGDANKVVITRNGTSVLNYGLEDTIDGGTNWTFQNMSTGGLSFANSDVPAEFIDGNSDGLIVMQLRVSGSLLAFTSNYGNTWHEVFSSPTVAPFGGAVRLGLNGAVYVVRETSASSIIRSIDRGVTWTPFDVSLAFTGVTGGTLTDTIYFHSSSTVDQLLQATTRTTITSADLVSLPSPGTFAGRQTLALIEEGIYVPVDLPIDVSVTPPGSSTPGSLPNTPGAGGSWIYDLKNFGAGDAWADGAPQPLISLHDRVPPGKYAVARGTSGQTAVTYASSAKSQGARGIILVLGDADDPPTNDFAGGPPVPNQYRAHGLRWQPDPNGKAWQKFQDELQNDQITADATTGTIDVPVGKIAGPQAIRDLDMVVGGMFICGKGAFDRPAQAAAMIASTRNRLNLDFICVDIDTKLSNGDPVWNTEHAANKLTILTHHIQQRCQRSPRAPNAVELSAHCPVFIVFPASPFGPSGEQLYPNLLSNPGAINQNLPTVDSSNLVPPFQHNYTAPVTFPLPRVPGNGNQTDLVNAWQWAKPMREVGLYIGLTQSGMMFDIRNGEDPSSIVSQVATNDALSVTFHNSGRPWSTLSGFIVYDGDGVIGGGTTPTKYWDFDGETAHNQYVPSIHPDPPPTGIINQFYEVWIDSRGRTISSDKAAALNGLSPSTPTDTSNVQPYSPSGAGTLTTQEAYQLAVQSGFTGDAAITAVAIMIAESGLVAAQIGTNKDSSGAVTSIDRGIVQINNVFHPEVSDTCAFDPVCAVHAMFTISSGGTDFTPWATFNQGTYLPHVGEVQEAAGTATGTTGPVGPGVTGTARKLPLRVWFENWKAGNTVSEDGVANTALLPKRFDISDPGCTGLRESVPSWIEVNGRWMIPLPNTADYLYEIDNNQRLAFSGTPRDGDEGLYVIGVAASRSFSITPTTLFHLAIPVSNPKKMSDGTTTQSGIPSVMPDAKPLDHPDDSKDGSPLRAVMPLINPVPIALLCDASQEFSADFCPGVAPPMPALPLPPRGLGVVPTTSTLCSAPYITELAPAAFLNCHDNNIGVGEFGVCWFGGNQSLYVSFVTAAARAISHYDPHYTAKCGTGHPNADPATGCCQFGLFGIDLCAGTGVGRTREDLFDPAINAAIAFPDLRIAFQDANVSMHGASPCASGARLPFGGFSETEVAQHALIGFMERSGMFPGVHGSRGEVGLELTQAWHIAHECQLTTTDATANAMIATLAGTINCYRSNFSGGGIPVGPGQSGGQQGTLGQTGGGGVTTGGYISGCPRGGTLTADCDWHYANEGIPAIDVACSNGDALFAACDGTLVFRGIDPYARSRNGLSAPNINLGLGVEVRIKCSSGNMTMRYGHTLPADLNNGALPTPGSHVAAGDVVAHCDTSGYAFGSHTHIETWQGDVPTGTRVCPQEVLPSNCP